MSTVAVLNTSAELSGSTLITEEDSATIEGLHTFDRDPSAPFAVTASSAVVPNLDADKVDGYEASGLARLDSANTFSHATPIVLGGAAQGNLRTDVAGYFLIQGGTTGTLVRNSTNVTDLFGISEGGAVTVPILLSITGQTVVTPVTHAGGNNCSVGTVSSVRFTAAPTGIAGGQDGRILYIINGTGGDLVLSEEDVLSSAANRFAAIAGMSIDWRDGGVIQLFYNGNKSRWQVIGTAI
jgi:hypothetical protein